MKHYKKSIPDVIVLENEVYKDERGFFYESFVQKEFNEIVGREISFVQDNCASSRRGVLRGMHYQEEPYAQGKLISVIEGEIYDVALDIREGSSSYGQWTSEYLSSKNKKQMWIPEGFAHGYLALTENVFINYKTTNYYSKKYERVITYNNDDYKVNWPDHVKYIISEKDLIDL
jgi:dTDP-4-dehydrorhamnose 3,5-epimerase